MTTRLAATALAVLIAILPGCGGPSEEEATKQFCKTFSPKGLYLPEEADKIQDQTIDANIDVKTPAQALYKAIVLKGDQESAHDAGLRIEEACRSWR